ncbi:MAG: DUF4174 domain-containing protein [Roseovarius sp.]
MKYALSLVLAAFVSTTALSQDADDLLGGDTIVSAEEVSLEDFRWLKRALVVFADTPEDPNFQQQMRYIEDRLAALEARDVVVVTDTDPAARTDIRRELRPRGFGLVLVGKEGSIVMRKPTPWDIREITRAIDKN